MLLGDLPRARKSLEDFIGRFKTHRFHPAALVNLGDVDYREGRFANAKQTYESALETTDAGRIGERARYGLGLASAELGEGDRAISLLHELAKQNAAEWADRAWYQIGRINLARGKPAEALEAWEALEKAAPKSRLIASVRIDRGVAFGQLKQFDKAESILQPLVGDPSPSVAARASNVLGQVERAAGRPEKAVQIFDEALIRFASTALAPELVFHSAEAIKDLGKPEEARRRFLEIVKEHPDDAWADDALYQAASLRSTPTKTASQKTSQGRSRAAIPRAP